MRTDVFVLGLTSKQREELQTVLGAGHCAFYDLLGYDDLLQSGTFDFDQMLDRARDELDRFDGTPRAILTHWDFPTSVLGPLLAAERGLPAPSLESILKCEHKLWSRIEQEASIPQVVPRFQEFDPFDEDPARQVDLNYPFWVKPVKAFSSNLGFLIEGPEDFAAALEEIRAEISDIGDPFEQVLRRVDLPERVAQAGGNACLAEDVMTGQQFALEGSTSVVGYDVHGLIDMHKDERGQSLTRLDYPAVSVPENVQHAAVVCTGRFLDHIGFENGCFNAEFMWDGGTGVLRMVEVNTRISQSHSDMFAKVDGRSNHQIALDVALGDRPHLPSSQGEFSVATQYHVGHRTDAVVRAVPQQQDLDRIAEELPGTTIEIRVSTGDRLSEMPHQDQYCFVLATVYAGASDHEELTGRLEKIESMLPFTLEPVAAEGDR